MKGPDQHHWSRNIVRRVEGWINQLLTCLIEPGVRGLISPARQRGRKPSLVAEKARRHNEVLKTVLLPLTK